MKWSETLLQFKQDVLVHRWIPLKRREYHYHTRATLKIPEGPRCKPCADAESAGPPRALLLFGTGVQLGNGLRDGLGIGISHHVAGALHQMQERMRQRPFQTPRLFRFDQLVLRAMEDVDRTGEVRIAALEAGGRWNKEGAFLSGCAQLFGPNRQRNRKILRKFLRHRSWRKQLA